MSAIASLIVRNDILCFYALNRKIHCSFLNLLMKAITQLGSTAFAVSTSLLLLLYVNSTGVMLAANLLVSQAIIHSLKRIVNRTRPYKALNWAIAIELPKCKYSLPSGHSSSALSIALVISFFLPSLNVIFVSAALLVGISRIYLGCHYPTDVTIGFIISYSVFISLEYLIFV